LSQSRGTKRASGTCKTNQGLSLELNKVWVGILVRCALRVGDVDTVNLKPEV